MSAEAKHWYLYLVAYKDSQGDLQVCNVKTTSQEPYSAWDRWRTITKDTRSVLVAITYLFETGKPEPGSLI